jgi:hypothetical protein
MWMVNYDPWVQTLPGKTNSKFLFFDKRRAGMLKNIPALLDYLGSDYDYTGCLDSERCFIFTGLSK